MSNLPSLVRWVLLASLALNVVLGAALALPWLASDHDRPRHARTHGRDHMPSPRHVRRVLGEDRADVVEAVMKRHRPDIRATFPPLREARRAAHAAIAADPFDGAALERAFADLRARDADSKAAIQAMLVELMAQLTPAERRKVIDSMPKRERVRRRGDDASREGRREGSVRDGRSPTTDAAGSEAGSAADGSPDTRN